MQPITLRILISLFTLWCITGSRQVSIFLFLPFSACCVTQIYWSVKARGTASLWFYADVICLWHTVVCSFCYVAPKLCLPRGNTASSQFLQFPIARSVESQLWQICCMGYHLRHLARLSFCYQGLKWDVVKVTGYISLEVSSKLPGFRPLVSPCIPSEKGAPL